MRADDIQPPRAQSRRSRHSRAAAAAVFAAIGVLCAAPEAAFADELAPGVEYSQLRTDAPQDIYVAEIDITRDDIAIRATEPGDAGMTTSRFASEYDCEIAVNGDFYDTSLRPIGLAVGGGRSWPGTTDSPRHGVVVTTPEGRVDIRHPTDVTRPAPGEIRDAVGGTPLLVWDGEPIRRADCGAFCARHPRTAVGVSEDGDRLLLVVVDGRSEASKGATLIELAAIMARLGAHRALGLDGGGSSTMYVKSQGGVVNRPSGGFERPAANHLGVCRGERGHADG